MLELAQGTSNIPTENPAQLPSKHPMASILGSLPLWGKKSQGNGDSPVGCSEAARGPVPLTERRVGVCGGSG